MKKLIILFIISIIGQITTSIYTVKKMATLSETPTPASEFADAMTLPIILSAVWAVLFWVSLIAMIFIGIKKLLAKR